MYTINYISIQKQLLKRQFILCKNRKWGATQSAMQTQILTPQNFFMLIFVFSSEFTMRNYFMPKESIKVMSLLGYRNSSKFAIPQNSRLYCYFDARGKVPQDQANFFETMFMMGIIRFNLERKIIFFKSFKVTAWYHDALQNITVH